MVPSIADISPGSWKVAVQYLFGYGIVSTVENRKKSKHPHTYDNHLKRLQEERNYYFVISPVYIVYVGVLCAYVQS